jgi:hypothetical protein
MFRQEYKDFIGIHGFTTRAARGGGVPGSTSVSLPSLERV